MKGEEALQYEHFFGTVYLKKNAFRNKTQQKLNMSKVIVLIII